VEDFDRAEKGEAIVDIGISANFPWFGPKFTDLAFHIEQLDPVDPKEAIPAYEEAGVNRMIIGMVDMVDDSAFRNIEVVAKGLVLN
jgi:hypothetical protein